MEGEPVVFAGEFVGVVDTAVTAVAERSFVGGAVNGGFSFLTHVALDLHFVCLIN